MKFGNTFRGMSGIYSPEEVFVVFRGTFEDDRLPFLQCLITRLDAEPRGEQWLGLDAEPRGAR